MKKFIILNLFSLVAVVGLGVLMLRETAQATATLRELTAVAAVERDATEIRAQMVTMSDALRGFLLDPSKQGEFDRKKAADAELSEAVDRLTTESADAEYVRLAGAIGQLDEDALDPLEDRVLELAPTNAANAVRVYFDEYLPVRVKQTGLVDELRTLASRRFHERATSAQASMQRASTVVTWAGGILGLLMVGAFAWSVRSTRAVERQLSSETTTMADTAHGVLRASRELSKAAQSLSQGATEQAASLEQTSASMEEMASVVRRNADHSKQAADLMHGVDASVRRSNACLDEMVTSMTAIQQSSQEVARIIKTIDEIAFQTNILALNAAVEAARAGDAGMGFAVVADEVRSLALRSAQAARDTAVLIEASLSRTTAGQAKVEQVAEAITSITASVTAVKGLVDQVSTATSEQADGISQVAQAVAQMERVTQTTAATAEESAASSEELNAQAESALLVVTRLEQLVGTRRADEPPPTRAEEPTMPRSLRPAA